MQEIALAQIDAHVVAQVLVVDGVEAHQVAAPELADPLDAVEPVVVALAFHAALQDVVPGRAVAEGRIAGAVEAPGRIRILRIGRVHQRLGHVDGLFDLGGFGALRGGPQLPRHGAALRGIGLGGGEHAGLDIALPAPVAVRDAHAAALHAQRVNQRALGHRGERPGHARVPVHRGALRHIGLQRIDAVQVFQADVARPSLVDHPGPAL